MVCSASVAAWPENLGQLVAFIVEAIAITQQVGTSRTFLHCLFQNHVETIPAAQGLNESKVCPIHKSWSKSCN